MTEGARFGLWSIRPTKPGYHPMTLDQPDGDISLGADLQGLDRPLPVRAARVTGLCRCPEPMPDCAGLGCQVNPAHPACGLSARRRDIGAGGGCLTR